MLSKHGGYLIDVFEDMDFVAQNVCQTRGNNNCSLYGYKFTT